MTRLLIIIAAEHLLSARALAGAAPFSLSEADAAALFVPAGSPTGELPATHWWAAGLFTVEQVQALQTLDATVSWGSVQMYDLTEAPGRPMEALEKMGLQPLTPVMP